MAWPKRLNLGSVHQTGIYQLYFNKQNFERAPEEYVEFHEPSQWLLGYAIPSFQRPVVWGEDRMVKFVESAILGLNLGSYTYNSTMNGGPHPKDADGKERWFADLWLIDGQQRLTALDRYWDDEFKVFDLYWSEISAVEQRKFLTSTAFPSYVTNLHDEAALRDLYDRMNFGGIAHTEDQRATLSSLSPR